MRGSAPRDRDVPDHGSVHIAPVRYHAAIHNRGRRGATVSVIAICSAIASGASFAKTPGEIHCYRDICHRVKSLEEMRRLVGTELDEIASYYDIPERDRFNTGKLTSSGQTFNAWSDSHAASSLYPDGTELLLWNPRNGRASHVRINDFGPFYRRRTIDVTRGVAEKLDFGRLGVTTLRVIIIWAPDASHARYRRQRIYPPVAGYLGQFDADQLIPLKRRLIAQAPERNGIQGDSEAIAGGPWVGTGAALGSPRAAHSLDALPAYANPAGEDAEEAAEIAWFVNEPRVPLEASSPVVAISVKTPTAVVPVAATVVPVRDASDGVALVANARPAAAVMPSEQALTVSSARNDTSGRDGRTMERHVASRPAPGDGMLAMMINGTSLRLPSADSQAWQSALLALVLLSAAAAGWRTRSPRTRAREHDAATATGPAGDNGFPVASDSPLAGEKASAAVARTAQPEALTTVHGAGAGVDRLPAAVMLAWFATPEPPVLVAPPPAASDQDLCAEATACVERFAYAEAEASYRRLLTLRERSNGLSHPLTGMAEQLLADCLRAQGRHAAAEPYYRRALVCAKRASGDLHPAVADVLDEYAICLLRQGHATDAQCLARQSLAIRRIAGSYSRPFAVTLSIAAEANRALGNLADAETEHRTAWGCFIAHSGADSLDAAAAMMSLGTVLSAAGRHAAAEDLINKGARIVAQACGGDHPAVANAYSLVGDLYHRAGRNDAADAMHAYALSIRERVLGPHHPDTIESQLAMVQIATLAGNMDQARSMLGSALTALAVGERQPLGPTSRIRSLMDELRKHHDIGAG